MRIEISDRGVDASESLRNYVGLRLMSSLDDLVEQVDCVAVSLVDVDPRDDGVAKCRMRAIVRRGGDASVEETGPGPYAAIDIAAKQLSQATELLLTRRGTRIRLGAPGSRGHMSVWIRSRGFELTEALRVFTERRLRGAIPGRLRSVTVRLDDVNGPRGGHDKRCQIVAQLAPRGDVRIQERNGDLYTAISRAARRLERTVARIAERQLRRRGFRDTFGREEA